jgi:hypothetical protein
VFQDQKIPPLLNVVLINVCHASKRINPILIFVKIKHKSQLKQHPHNVLNGTDSSGKVFPDQKIPLSLYVGLINVYHAKAALSGII